MPAWISDSIEILSAVFLVLLNGFFVAAEFSLVKVRGSQLEVLVREGRPFARTAAWLSERLEASLSACQLGITMASLGLGWVGEPAVADTLKPLLRAAGISSDECLAHGFVYHCVYRDHGDSSGCRRAGTQDFCDSTAGGVGPLVRSAPHAVLHAVVSVDGGPECVDEPVAAVGGHSAGDDHEVPHTEDEIRELVEHSHSHGELTRSENKLILAVFEFDDLICRRVMVPRGDVVFFDVDAPVADSIEPARRDAAYALSPL